MRKDIEIHINTGDVELKPTPLSSSYPFRWVENKTGLNRYLYGEIEIPGRISDLSVKSNGVCFDLPYTPKYKEFFVRIKRSFGGQDYLYVQNPVDGSEWFLARCGLYGGQKAPIFASQLSLISKSKYYIYLNGAYADLYSGVSKDFNVVGANRQNANLMLKCAPTNNYRYPLTGVGLIRWVNSNIQNTNLSEVLTREFEADGVGIKNATFDFETKDLHLDLDTSRVD